jgi:sugar/nucleoside kinase (ribokinase family)
MKTILCYGAICADYELTVPRLPTAGTGVHVTAARWLAGGNALNEALALRSWGMRPQLWGDVLGTEAAGATVLAALQAADLTAAVQVAADAVTPICHVLVTPDGERTILALRAGTRALVPDDAALAAAEIVSVARYGLQTLEVITRARALNRLVVVGDVRTADDPAAQAANSTRPVTVSTRPRAFASAPVNQVSASIFAITSVRIAGSSPPVFSWMRAA